MTKDVLLSLSGLQYEMGEDTLEVVTPAIYYNRNGKHYVVYEELSEESGLPTKVMLKFSEQKFEMIKQGESNVHMLFEQGKQATSIYELPFGSLAVGIHTTDLEYTETEQALTLKILYGLDVNYAHVSDCAIQIQVAAKEGSPDFVP